MKHFAIEGLPGDAELTVEPVNLDDEAAQILVDRQDIDSTQAEIEEVESIGEYLDGAVERVEQAEETGGMSEEAASEVRAAVEHFQRRLKLTKPVVASVESFRADKVSSTSKTKAELKVLQASLNKEMELVQEGLASRVGNAIVRMLTSYDSAVEKIKKLEKMVPSGKAMSFQDPAWGRIFASTGKKRVDASDILAMRAEMVKERNRVMPLMEKAMDLVAKAMEHATASTFVAGKEDIKAIQDLAPQIDQVVAQLTSQKVKYEKASVDIDVIEVKEQEKIAQSAIKSANDERSKLQKLNKRLTSLDRTVLVSSQMRLNGLWSADTRQYFSTTHRIGAVLENIAREHVSLEFHFCYAVLKMLEATTK